MSIGFCQAGPAKSPACQVPEHAPIDPLLPIIEHPNAAIFHARQQVWSTSPISPIAAPTSGLSRMRPPFIQYADLSDLMLMLDMMLGGGVMDAVNEGQKLIEPRTML